MGKKGTAEERAMAALQKMYGALMGGYDAANVEVIDYAEIQIEIGGEKRTVTVAVCQFKAQSASRGSKASTMHELQAQGPFLFVEKRRFGPFDRICIRENPKNLKDRGLARGEQEPSETSKPPILCASDWTLDGPRFRASQGDLWSLRLGSQSVSVGVHCKNDLEVAFWKEAQPLYLLRAQTIMGEMAAYYCGYQQQTVVARRFSNVIPDIVDGEHVITAYLAHFGKDPRSGRELRAWFGPMKHCPADVLASMQQMTQPTQ